MKQAFIIMQIGNEELDKIYKEAIVPALKTFNLEAKRVDKHNRGGLLKSEIVAFINEADIIIADLTNERPNCYLEVGYAMGREKYPNLILTAREDHNPDSPNYVKNGPKVHFDLTGYDILWWEKDKLKAFKEELEKRIRRRLTIISSTGKPVVPPIDTEWMKARQSEAFSDSTYLGNVPMMEVEMALFDSKLEINQTDLLAHAEKAALHTTGWPIGVVLHVEEKRPKPTKDGIVARVFSDGRKSYDYWALKKDGQFYMMRIENPQKHGFMAFDTKIFRVTEVLQYCASLYLELGASPNAQVFIAIRHSGLKNLEISSDENRMIFETYRSTENAVSSEIVTAPEEIQPKIVELVETITKPLFVLFDYFTVPRKTVEEIVKKFVVRKA
ncbi:nucleoside 2-deoxyribosyltransferase [Candidatus Bathyarchaeota archaeon]|nr:nucleoside 2-deoxyribosyltransferase [Candidatus Bathyarchaeota archaeon]